MTLVLPWFLGKAGAIGLGALGAYEGVRLGKFLNDTLSTKEKEYLSKVFERFGIVDISNTHQSKRSINFPIQLI